MGFSVCNTLTVFFFSTYITEFSICHLSYTFSTFYQILKVIKELKTKGPNKLHFPEYIFLKYVLIYMDICLCVYTCICLCMCVLMYVYGFVLMCMCVYKCVCMCVLIYHTLEFLWPKNNSLHKNVQVYMSCLLNFK